MPMTVLRYTVTNTSDKEATVTLNSRLQNPVFLELRDDVSAKSRNKIVNDNGNTSVFYDVVENKVVNNKIVPFDSFNDFKNWTIKGNAFGKAPVSGTVERQSAISGQKGTFLNSFHGADSSIGEALSKEFTITQNNINFLIGGGASNKTAFQLLINGKVVASASGKNNEHLKATNWDVSKYKGQKAQFRVVDNNSGGWDISSSMKSNSQMPRLLTVSIKNILITVT